MTSRSSFFKLLKEDLRQRLWTIILAAIVFILPVPIYLAMEISNTSGYRIERWTNYISDLAGPMAADSAWMVLITVVGAFICAVSGFGYLFSKKKVDFFHSLPVKRETLFAVRYINGILIYLVPYLVMLLVSFVILAVTGNFESVVLTVTGKGLLVHLLGYLTIYTTLILCVAFVGNIVVFFAVSGWTFGITLATMLIYSWFEEKFFDTFSYMGDVYADRIHALRFLCPGYFYVMAVQDPEVSLLLQQLAFTAVVAVITLLVYRSRPSDGAGKAISFPILKPVIRISVELLAGALIGMLFYEMADGSGRFPGWMLFGIVLGVVLSHMLIQSIFHFDVRKCFADKVSMFACIAVTMAFALVMRYDVFGYDMYLPKAKKIESVAIDLQSLDNRRDSYIYDNGQIRWFDEVTEMKLLDIAAVYPYLEVLVEDSAIYADRLDSAMAYSYNEFLGVEVAYHLKNGKTVQRRYRVNGMREELFAPIFESYEYKKVHYGDIYTIPSGLIKSVSAQCAMNTCVMELSQAEKDELMTVLNRELAAMTLAEKLHTQPVAILNLTVGPMSRVDAYGNSYSSNLNVYSNELPIYASYTETLRFLADRGFVTDAEYEWTGKEAMRVRLPEIEYKYGSDYYVGEVYSAGSVEVTEYALSEDMKQIMQTIAYPEDWGYGDNVIPVEPEDFERLYALCTWEPLCRYGDPTYDVYEDYRVYLDIPQDGYNMYETFNYVVSKDADLSFLFD